MMFYPKHTYAFKEDWTSTVTQYAPPHSAVSAVFWSTKEIPILQKRFKNFKIKPPHSAKHI